MKKARGFTLIELMIVIAVIALLMLVLVPRIGGIKSKTKEAGIKSNMLILEGMIQSMIDDYPATAEGVAAFEARLAGDINVVQNLLDPSEDGKKFRNPVSGGMGVVDDDPLLGGITAGTVFAYDATDDDGNNGDDIDASWTDGTVALNGSAGIVAFAAYVNTDTSKLNVKLIPFASDNTRITALEKTISQ